MFKFGSLFSWPAVPSQSGGKWLSNGEMGAKGGKGAGVGTRVGRAVGYVSGVAAYGPVDNILGDIPQRPLDVQVVGTGNHIASQILHITFEVWLWNAHTHVPGYQRSRKISESALAREPAQLGFCRFPRCEICCFLLRLTWPRHCHNRVVITKVKVDPASVGLLACCSFQLSITRILLGLVRTRRARETGKRQCASSPDASTTTIKLQISKAILSLLPVKLPKTLP